MRDRERKKKKREGCGERKEGAFILMGHPHTISPDSTASVHWDSPCSSLSLPLSLTLFFLSLDSVLVGQVTPSSHLSSIICVGVGRGGFDMLF